jgi:hypothetical protein
MKIIIDSNHSLSISEGNAKMGKVPSFSVTPLRTCPAGIPCAGLCYARRMAERRDNTANAYRNNTESILHRPNDVVRILTSYIRMRNLKYFRFNVAGDFNLRGYFSLACKVARECPETQFLAFTKDYRIQELRKPHNINIVLSVWKDYAPENPKYGLAYFDDSTPECNVPETGFVCPGNCKSCLYCFTMKKNQAVIFKKH